MLSEATRSDRWRPRGKRASILASSLLAGLFFGLQSTTLLAGDEEHLRSRTAELHTAMGSGDLAAWYSLSSASTLPGNRLSFDDFKRIYGLEDSYGHLQRWDVRQATLKSICNCQDYQYPEGTRVVRCGVLIDFVFNDGQKVEELELWDSIQGQWYWSHTDAQRECAIAR